MAHPIGIIGLGRMGMQVARRLHKKGRKVVAWNRSPAPRSRLARFFKNSPNPLFNQRGGKEGVQSMTVKSIPELVKVLARPRIIWLMLPAGETDNFIGQLSGLLSKDDIVIDGSNSFYLDSQSRAKQLARRQIHYLDCGTSGGVWGERNGFSIMVGGERKIFKKVEPIFKALAAGDLSPNLSPSPGERSFPSPGDGEGKRERSKELSYGLVGKNGAGHFVKMVHNGIEYGMMEAIAEGFAVLDKSPFKLNLAQVAQIWHKGAVVSSWLIDLARDIFEKENLRKILGFIPHTGEGEWTIKEARHLGVDVRVIKDAFRVRLESSRKKNQNKLSNKIVALLRNRFGGHEVTRNP